MGSISPWVRQGFQHLTPPLLKAGGLHRSPCDTPMVFSGDLSALFIIGSSVKAAFPLQWVMAEHSCYAFVKHCRPISDITKRHRRTNCMWIFKGRWDIRWMIQLKVKEESSKLLYIKKKQECCSCVINQAVPHHGWESLHLHVSSCSHLGIPLLLGPEGLQAMENMCV